MDQPMRLHLMRRFDARVARIAPGAVELDLRLRDDRTQHHGFLAAVVATR
ncbi:MAG TPA: hypothetical protein VFM04_09835 [Candidatus Methylomirabilis sp.]|nr:hypothetical protein [Candidatus Methylomirabilis sp.]